MFLQSEHRLLVRLSLENYPLFPPIAGLTQCRSLYLSLVAMMLFAGYFASAGGEEARMRAAVLGDHNTFMESSESVSFRADTRVVRQVQASERTLLTTEACLATRNVIWNNKFLLWN